MTNKLYIMRWKIRHGFHNWINAWAALAANVVTILTLTAVMPAWNLSVATYFLRLRLNIDNKKENQ